MMLALLFAAVWLALFTVLVLVHRDQERFIRPSR